MSTGLKTALSPAYRVRQLALALSDGALARRAAASIWAARVELGIVFALTVAAAVPRLVLLTEIPPGLHGDEGWTGIDARRVLDEGWIGPYVGSALGQPTGPLYFAAPIVGILGDSVFAVRLSMALLAIATIPVAYLTFRVMFDRTVAVFAAILLAFGLWHLHYSRIAFMVNSWPLMELLTLLFLFLGVKTGRWLYYGLAGLALGAGIYTYNAYFVFLPPLALLVAWLGIRLRGEELIRYAGQIGLLVLCAIIAALPMLLYINDTGDAYLNHHRGVSLLETEEWKDGGLVDKAHIAYERTRAFYLSAFWQGEPDGADGAGETAMVDRVSVFLVAAGAAILVWRWRRPAAVAVLLMIALLPFASVFSIGAMFRRTIGVAPFVAVMAAVPLAFWWDRAKEMAPSWRGVSYAGITFIVTLVSFLNLNYYFGEFRDTPLARFTFGEELTKASEYMRDLPGAPYIYFYSGRWSFDYETPRYLASNRQGENRSREFGTYSLELDREGAVAYVFLAPYLEQADEVARHHPGGTPFESTGADGVMHFRAYFLPEAGPVADEPPGEPDEQPTVSPTPAVDPGSAEEWDRARERDLRAVAVAFEQYREQNGAYPDTDGQVQSLCIFLELDVGCALREVLDPLPYDPLGDPTINGYWFASTENEFTVYAQRQSDVVSECPEHPPHLGAFESLLCVKGP